MAPSYRSPVDDPAVALVWVARALLGIYAVTVLAAALPLSLLEPAWIERVCGSLRGGVGFPLVAVALLLLADIFNDSQEEPGYLTLIRRLACFASIGFFLMIPLQTWAGIAVVQEISAKEQAQLRSYTRALTAIRTADTPDSLVQALAFIPGSPSNLGGTLKDPLPKVRAQLLRELEPQVKARQSQLEELQGRLLQEGLLRWFKDAVVALFGAIGFAAIGRFAVDRPTLLSSILDRKTPIRAPKPAVSLLDRLQALLPRPQPRRPRRPVVPLLDRLKALLPRPRPQRPRRRPVSLSNQLAALLKLRKPRERRRLEELENMMPPDPEADSRLPEHNKRR